MIAKILSACVAWSWWYELTVTSTLLFGEIPYPTKDDE